MFTMIRILVLSFSLYAVLVNAATGVDVSSPISRAAWDCLKSSQGVSFGVVRTYESVGRVDPNARTTIANAIAANISVVDAYLFPCVSCGNPAGQVDATVAALKDLKTDTLWFDIEIYRWGSQTTNRNFITGLIDRGKTLNVKMGIYTNLNNWASIVGASWNGASSLPLWYAHYDNSPNFGDFRAFGGWTKPAIKQYRGNLATCNVGVDLNWHP